MSMSVAERMVEYAADLRRALRLGWLNADDRGAYCNYCRETAEHESPRGHFCKHADDCLMVRRASLVGDVSDGEDE